jgi:hypothetical protein
MQTEGMPEGKPPYLNNQEIGMFKATDWEPFEISPCTVPADFNTCFLSAQPTGEIAVFGTPDSGVMDAIRAISPQKEKPAMPETTQATGADARVVNEQALAAAREEAVQGRTVARQRDHCAGRHRPTLWHRQDRHQRVHRQGRLGRQARKELFAAMEARQEGRGAPIHPRIPARRPAAAAATPWRSGWSACRCRDAAARR